MEKIEKNEISNPEEILLLDSLECPIDNIIPLKPYMCSKCHTIFCKECIEKWKEKSNDCPMRCSPFNIIEIKNSIINQQLNLIKVNCKFMKNGCSAKILLKEIKIHEDYCNYREINCDKCNERIIFLEKLNHLKLNCEKNKIQCFICEKLLFLNEIEEHIIKCEKNNFIDCEECLNYHLRKEDCVGELKKCSNCLVDVIEDDTENHNCVSEDSFIELYTHYNEMVSKYERTLNTHIKNIIHKMKIFNRNFKEKIEEMINLMKDKQSYIESELIIENKEVENLKNFKKKKLMKEIFKLNNEVLLIGKKVEELNDNENIFDLSIINLKDKFKVELSEKLDFQEKKNEFQKYLIDTLFLENKDKISPTLDLGKLDKNEEIKERKNEDIRNEIKNKSICDFCNVTNICYLQCNKCKKILCQKCAKICSNDDNHNYNKENENYQLDISERNKRKFIFCVNCLKKCYICPRFSCEKCIHKCYNKNCNTKICYFCFIRNQGQFVNKKNDEDCKIIKCYKCKNLTCVMASCNLRRRRYCVNCFRIIIPYKK